MSNSKFELTSETKVFLGITLYRIKALKSFGNVTKGDLGGFVETEANLSEEGNAWVFGNARVSENAWVFGNARVSENAWVFGDARVYGNAAVFGDARVSENAWVYGNARVYGNAAVFGDARVSGDADFISILKIGSGNGTLTAYKTKKGIECNRGCFSGTLKEFKKAVKENHGDSKIGREYKLAIKLINLRLGE